MTSASWRSATVHLKRAVSQEAIRDQAEMACLGLTTSRLMTTGVDAQTCKLIVLDRTINSPTEFKQIIGRGTRINEDYGKLYFTIMDFRQATSRFAAWRRRCACGRVRRARRRGPCSKRSSKNIPTAA